MKNKDAIITGLPFVPHVDQQARPTLKIDFLDKAYNLFFTNNSNLIQYGCYKLMGYKYDFKPYLKKYLYKQHGQWSEAYAPNKTKLRAVVYGNVEKIIEL